MSVCVWGVCHCEQCDCTLEIKRPLPPSNQWHLYMCICVFLGRGHVAAGQWTHRVVGRDRCVHISYAHQVVAGSPTLQSCSCAGHGTPTGLAGAGSTSEGPEGLCLSRAPCPVSPLRVPAPCQWWWESPVPLPPTDPESSLRRQWSRCSCSAGAGRVANLPHLRATLALPGTLPPSLTCLCSSLLHSRLGQGLPELVLVGQERAARLQHIQLQLLAPQQAQVHRACGRKGQRL